MSQIKPSVSASKDALAAIFGKDSSKAEVESEPPSGAQGEGTVQEPYDKGNAPEQVPESNATEQPPQPKQTTSHLESVMGKKEGKPRPAESVPTAVDPPKEEQKTTTTTEPEKKEEEGERGRKEWPSTRAGMQERSISPGTLPDGSHATTSGDKGQSYKTPTGVGKLKGKLFG